MIEAVRNRGYRLADSGDVLSEQELGRLLSTRWLGKNLVVFDEVDSTNNEARRMAEKGALEGTVILAAQSDCGKRAPGAKLGVSPGNRNLDELSASSGI